MNPEAIEAAARAAHEAAGLEWTDGKDWREDCARIEAKAALEAAVPYLIREAAAAGLRSVHDIWGAGGRTTVRMSELRAGDESILAGDWDNHLKWNLADIAKERDRAAAIRAGEA